MFDEVSCNEIYTRTTKKSQHNSTFSFCVLQALNLWLSPQQGGSWQPHTTRVTLHTRRRDIPCCLEMRALGTERENEQKSPANNRPGLAQSRCGEAARAGLERGEAASRRAHGAPTLPGSKHGRAAGGWAGPGRVRAPRGHPWGAARSPRPRPEQVAAASAGLRRAGRYLKERGRPAAVGEQDVVGAGARLQGQDPPALPDAAAGPQAAEREGLAQRRHLSAAATSRENPRGSGEGWGHAAHARCGSAPGAAEMAEGARHGGGERSGGDRARLLLFFSRNPQKCGVEGPASVSARCGEALPGDIAKEQKSAARAARFSCVSCSDYSLLGLFPVISPDFCSVVWAPHRAEPHCAETCIVSAG